jgi:hypothetical protein
VTAIIPNSDQHRALAWIESGHNPTTRCFVLSGYAGTGKTYLISQLVEKLRANGQPFVLMAPTGRAAKVLARRTRAPAHTIHKVIYAMDDLKEYVETNVDGSETYKFYFDLKNNGDDARTVYIVDEASMVSDVYSEGEFFRFGSGYLLKDLLKYVNFDNNDHNKKLIFVGDPAQLPPIGSNESPALKPEYLGNHYGLQAEHYEMTEVVRHRDGSGILDNATTLRDAIRTCRLNVLDIMVEKPDVIPIAYDKVVDRYAAFGGNKPPDKAIIIAHSNRMVNDYNRDIRARYYPGAVGPVPGDRLLVVANNHKGDVSLMNGDLVRLLAASPAVTSRAITLRTKLKGQVVEKTVPLVFRDVEIEADGEEGKASRFTTSILENLLDSPERDLSSDEQKALYVDFKVRNPTLKPNSALFKDALRADKYFNALRVKYGYAMTCHKAQGGEWPHVFVDFSQSGGVFNISYFRWAYTAITRAKEVLYTVNTPHYDALTLSKQSLNALSSYKIRDDLMVLNADNLENELAGALPQENPFLRRVYLAVSSLLTNSGVVIEKAESHRFCEHYTLRRGDDQARILIHYNAQEVVTSIRPAMRPDEAFTGQIIQDLTPLANKYIVLEGHEANSSTGSATGPVHLTTDFFYIRDAFSLMLKHTENDGLIITEAKVMSQYHLYCVYFKAGHTVAVDYHFDGKGRLTRAIPRSASTTNVDLMHQVLSYSSGNTAGL